MSAQQLVEGVPRLVLALVELMSRAAPLLRRGGGHGGRRRPCSQDGAVQLVSPLVQVHGSALIVLRTAGAAALPAVSHAMTAVLRSLLDCTHVAGYQPAELAVAVLVQVFSVSKFSKQSMYATAVACGAGGRRAQCVQGAAGSLRVQPTGVRQ